MAQKSNIEWTGVTWNPLAGCSRISTGCENCYAEKMTKRLSAMGQPKYHGLLNGHGRFNGVVNFDENALILPLKTKKPETYFVNSMSDLFHENVQDEWIDKVFGVIAMCPQHTFQILTKRPERMKAYFDLRQYPWIFDHNLDWWHSNHPQFASRLDDYACSSGHILPNCWLGVSAENQEQANKRIPILLQTPAAIRWVSAEPLLSDIDFTAVCVVNIDGDDGEINTLQYENWEDYLTEWKTSGDEDWQESFLDYFGLDELPSGHIHDKLDWIVAGGESGAGARPCQLAWIRSIVEQCNAARVPVFVKQLGSKPRGERLTEFHSPVIKLKNKKGGNIEEFPEDLQIRQFPTSKS
jgi:protein gp37